MAAIRFVVQGKGAYTAVDGEKFFMEEGDLILTPNWTWHDHHNESEDPIIWLDGLDGPLIQSLNVLFFEDSEKPNKRLPDRPVNRFPEWVLRGRRGKQEHRRGVPFRYALKDTYKALKAMGTADRDPYDGTLLRYINPATAVTPIRRCRARFSSLMPRNYQSASPHQFGALSCFQRPGAH